MTLDSVKGVEDPLVLEVRFLQREVDFLLLDRESTKARLREAKVQIEMLVQSLAKKDEELVASLAQSQLLQAELESARLCEEVGRRINIELTHDLDRCLRTKLLRLVTRVRGRFASPRSQKARAGRQRSFRDSALARTGIFDEAWYVARNEDVAACGLTGWSHFTEYGIYEGRDPSPRFSVAGYYALNPDVASAGVGAVDHFVLSGWREGRRTSHVVLESSSEK